MHHSLEVLNASGHLSIRWDPSRPEEVAEAREMVEKLRGEGYTFFVVAGSPGDDEVEQGNGLIIVRRIADPTDPKEDELEEALPPEAGTEPEPIATVCQGTTQEGKPCKHSPKKGTPYCGWHQPDKKLKGSKKKGGKKAAKPKSLPAPTPRPGRRHVAVRPMAGG